MDFEKEYRRARLYGRIEPITQEDQQLVQQEGYQEDDQERLEILHEGNEEEHQKDHGINGQPELEGVSFRRSARNRVPPKRYDDYQMDDE